jgi:GntR family transcriptional regulator, galactonate operon transcriptional repressor
LKRAPRTRQSIARATLHDRIVAELGRRIVTGEYGVEETLPNEGHLSTELGVSRTALREAVKVLISKGLVDVRPKTGTRIRPMADWSLLDRDILTWHAGSELHLIRAFELIEFRLVVEPKAAYLAALRATPDERTEIDEHCAALEASVGHPERVADCDIRFHRSIHAASHNALLNHLGSLTSSLMQIQVLLTSQQPGSFEKGLSLHRQLADTIKAGKASAAEAISRRLVQMPYDDLAERHRIESGRRLQPV